jgi:VanZ family protein
VSHRNTTALWLLLTLAWTTNMFWLSTDTFSGDQSRPLLARLLGTLHISLSPDSFAMLHAAVRKLAHVFEYAVLALLLYGTRRRQSRVPSAGWHPKIARWCFAACAVYSLADELHQLFAASRGASLTDCGLDVAGAALGILLTYFVTKIPRGARLQACGAPSGPGIRADVSWPTPNPPAGVPR